MTSSGFPKTPYEVETRRQLSTALSIVDKALKENPKETLIRLGSWDGIDVRRIYSELVETLAGEYPNFKEAEIEYDTHFRYSYYNEPSGALSEYIAVRFFTPKEMLGLMPTSIVTTMTCSTCGTMWDTYVFDMHSSCPKCGKSNYNDEVYRGRNRDESVKLIERAFFYELEKKWSGLYDASSTIRIEVKYGSIALGFDERRELESELRTRLSADKRFTSFDVLSSDFGLNVTIHPDTKAALKQERSNTPIDFADGCSSGCLMVPIILIVLGIIAMLFQ